MTEQQEYHDYCQSLNEAGMYEDIVSFQEWLAHEKERALETVHTVVLEHVTLHWDDEGNISIIPAPGYCFGPGATGIWYDCEMNFEVIPISEVEKTDLYEAGWEF